MLKQLRARLAKLKAEAKNLLDTADKESDGVLTEEQSTRFDEITAEIENVQKNIDQRVALDSMQLDDEQGQGRQTQVSEAGATVEVEDRIDPNGGFHNLAEFAQSVQRANTNQGIDDRLGVQGAPSNFHREGGSNDGYEIPPAMRNEIWDEVFNDDIDLFSMVVNEPTSSNQVEMLTDQSTPWGATGIQAYWGGEGKQLKASRLATENELMKLHKLHAFVLATEELLSDAPRLNSRLTRGAGEAIRWKLNEGIVYGNGAGQMKGYFNSGAAVSVAKESGQAADSIVPLNILKMFSRMLSGSIGRAVFLGNSDILPALGTMTIGDTPIWTPPTSGLATSPGGFLLGRPLMMTELAKTLGDKGDLQLVDPKGFYTAQKKEGVKMASSIHLFFDHDIEAFKWTIRVGGQPFLTAPVDPNNGSNTKSHFVLLDERA